MARPAAKQLGILGITREALAIPLRNGALTASVLLLVLLPFNLLVSVPKLSPHLSVSVNVTFTPSAKPLPVQGEASNGEPASLAESAEPPAGVLPSPSSRRLSITVAPLSWVVARLSMLAMVYLSAVACKGKHSTLGALLSKIKRSWKKVAVSFVYVQLFSFTYLIFFLMLGALTQLFRIHTLVLFLVLLALFSAFCFAFLVYLYLDIACQLSLVISAVEEDKCGLAALAKAVSLIRGRRLQGFVLTALGFALHRYTAADYAKLRKQKLTEITTFVAVSWFASVIVDLSVRLFVWLLWTVYYYECRKNHELKGKEDSVDEGQSLLPLDCSADGDFT